MNRLRICAWFRGRCIYFDREPFRVRNRHRRIQKTGKWLRACHREIREALQVPPGGQMGWDGGAVVSVGPDRPPLPPGCVEVYL